MADETVKTPEAVPPSIVPGGRRKPRMDVSRAKILLFGPPKIGKSTFASQFPGAWFLATEAGQDWLDVHEPTVIKSWDQFLEVCMYIETNKPETFGDGTPIRTIVIDTGELLFKMCQDHVCSMLGVANIGDLEWGKGWTALSDEFQRVLTKMSRWPYGMIFICHAVEKEIKSKASKIDRVQPAIMSTGLKVIHALCDLILYAYVDEIPEKDPVTGDLTGRIIQERVIRCQPSNNIMAGDRTGRLPEVIPLSYAEMIRYFPDSAAPVVAAPGEELSETQEGPADVG